MRPDHLGDRPFFRPEAEKYRRLRHLGDITLFRPLSLRLVTLYPLVVAALLVFAMSQLELRSRAVALMEEVTASGQALRLSLDRSAAGQLQQGDRIELRVTGSEARLRGSIAEITTGACSPEARAFLLARTRGSAPRCAQLTIATDPATSPELPTTPVVAELWSPPQNYLAHLLRR